MARAANAHTWPAHLLKLRGRQWLQERRLQLSSISMQSGCTGTRLHSGRPRMRWRDGAVLARGYLQNVEQLPAASIAARGRAELDRIVQQQRQESDTLVAQLSCSGPRALTLKL